ncbi:hypothetical protein STEG23_024513 [Scotinomys teguina]
MSRVPLGKVLLRNVIRHTDAHNKIQEESDMWKIRELEKQMEDAYQGTRRNTGPSSSSRMRSDGFDEESQRDYWRTKSEIPGALEDDFLKAKSWNKKLYDYESNMPDRWGHSGYKELYPEEFETDRWEVRSSREILSMGIYQHRMAEASSAGHCPPHPCVLKPSEDEDIFPFSHDDELGAFEEIDACELWRKMLCFAV